MTVVHPNPRPGTLAEKIARFLGALTLGLSLAFGTIAPALADPSITTLPIGIAANSSYEPDATALASHAARIRKLHHNPTFRKLTRQLKRDEHRLHRLEARTLRNAHSAAERLRLLRKLHRSRAFRRLEKKIRVDEKRLHRLEAGHATTTATVAQVDSAAASDTVATANEAVPKHKHPNATKDFPIMETGLAVMGSMVLFTLLRPKKKATGDGLTLKERKMTYS